MATQFARGYCYRCKQPQKLARPGRNHILHLLLSVVTVGVWLVVWLLLSITSKHWRCDSCGSTNVKRQWR